MGDKKVLSWRVYTDEKGEYRWEIKAGNGRIIHAATEGYKRSTNAIANMISILGGAPLQMDSVNKGGENTYASGHAEVTVEDVERGVARLIQRQKQREAEREERAAQVRAEGAVIEGGKPVGFKKKSLGEMIKTAGVRKKPARKK